MIFFGTFFTVSYYYLLGSITKLSLYSKNQYLEPKSIFFDILKGIIFISFLALLLHFFLPLDKYVNTFLVFSVFLISFYKKNFILIKKNLNYLLVFSLISTLFVIFSNINRPDAALYHLPYVSYLNEHKIVIGMNNIHFRFAATSIVQYLSAINYNLFFSINSISIPLSVFALTIIFYFLEKIYNFIKTENYNYEFFFILFCSIFIAYKMNRYSGYGNDNTTHLLYYLLISFLLNKDFKKNFDLICYISVFLFLNKSTYVLVLLIPIIYFFINKLYLNGFIIYKKFLSPYAFFLYLWLLKNILISGCVIYPLTKSCITNLQWTKDLKIIKQESISSEAWAKGWPQYKGGLDQANFNKEFNWLKAWSDTHLKKIVDILFPYILISLSLLLIIILSRNKENYLNEDKDLKLLIILNSFFVLIFFLKFPLFRYGSSYLISLIVLLFISFIKNFNLKTINKLSKITLVLIIIIFNGKQLLKIKNNFHRDYINKPWPNLYSLDDNYIHKKIKFQNYKNLKIYYSNRECAYSKPICGSYKPYTKFDISHLLTYYVVKKN